MAEIGPEVTHGNQQLSMVLDSLYNDINTIRTAVNTIVTKMNADGGVSDADYVAVTTLETTHI